MCLLCLLLVSEGGHRAKLEKMNKLIELCKILKLDHPLSSFPLFYFLGGREVGTDIKLYEYRSVYGIR